MLKLLFAPELNLETTQGEPIFPDASILATLRAGDVNRACELASRRLRASGRTPTFANAQHSLDSTRLAAALLIPLAMPAAQLNSLPLIAQLVLRSTKTVS